MTRAIEDSKFHRWRMGKVNSKNRRLASSLSVHPEEERKRERENYERYFRIDAMANQVSSFSSLNFDSRNQVFARDLHRKLEAKKREREREREKGKGKEEKKYIFTRE